MRAHPANPPFDAPKQMERYADEGQAGTPLTSTASEPLDQGIAMYIRIVTFGLAIPAEAYAAHAVTIAPGFGEWPGLLGKWWLGDQGSGTYGGVYLFASTQAADQSRETDLFQSMMSNPALTDVTVREYEVLSAPTAITAPMPPGDGALEEQP